MFGDEQRSPDAGPYSEQGPTGRHTNGSRIPSATDLHLAGHVVLAIIHLSPFVPAVPRSVLRRLHIVRDVFLAGLALARQPPALAVR